MRMGDEGALVKCAAIPTGALSLDLALGIGGMPRGRIVEVFGPESSGKTTLVYHILAEAQKLGGICAFIDAEHAMDPLYAREIGVDIDELLVSQPDYGEQALEVCDMLVRSGAVDVVALDSVAALTPRVELEGQMGDQTVGLQARMMSQAMRKLAGNLNRTQTLCLFTNQIREKVGVMFGSPETQPGGRALKFYASQRLDIRRIETLKEGTEAVGNRVRVKVVKNKVAAPFRQAEFDIEFGKGISTSGCLLDLGVEHNVVSKSGSFFSFNGERLGQGRNNSKAFLDEHQEIAKEIETKVWAALGLGPDLVVPIERDEAVVAGPGRRRRRGDRGRLARRRLDGARRRWRATSAHSSWPSATSASATARRRRSAVTSPAGTSASRPPRRRSPSWSGWATSTTRVTRGPSPRTAARSTPGARSASSAGCGSWASTASTSRRRSASVTGRPSSKPRSSCCGGAAARFRPTSAGASGRSGCSSARATTSNSRTTPCARSSAPRPPEPARARFMIRILRIPSRQQQGSPSALRVSIADKVDNASVILVDLVAHARGYLAVTIT